MAFDKLEFSKNWEDPNDFPTYEADETQVRKDYQALHDETKEYINETLLPQMEEELAKKVNDDNVLHKDETEAFTPTMDTHPANKKYVDDVAARAALGNLPDRSVTSIKMAESFWDEVSRKEEAAAAADHNIETYDALAQIGLDDANLSAVDATANFIAIFNALGKRAIFCTSISNTTNLAQSIRAKLKVDTGLDEGSYLDVQCFRSGANMLQIDVVLQFYNASTLYPADRYSCVLRYTSGSTEYLSPFVLTRARNGFYGPDNKPSATDVGLGNVPNVATNDQTPTYSEAATLTALTSGEKLSVAFGKIKKAVASLISHLANKSNPHGVTKTQVGLGSVPNVATNDQTPTYTQASSLAKPVSGEKLSVSMGKITKAVADLISHLANSSNPHGVTATQAGALPANGTAAAATKLATARTIRTNLGSTSAASFNGTANATPGVTGTLPITNGGTGAVTAAAALANLGAAQVVAGSYVGTGGYGSGSPCTLTFSFAPKLVLIYAPDMGFVHGSASFNSQQSALLIAAYGATSAKRFSPIGNDAAAIVTDHFTWGNTTFRWYSSVDSELEDGTVQFNAKGTTYCYLAIG